MITAWRRGALGARCVHTMYHELASSTRSSRPRPRARKRRCSASPRLRPRSTPARSTRWFAGAPARATRAVLGGRFLKFRLEVAGVKLQDEVGGARRAPPSPVRSRRARALRPRARKARGRRAAGRCREPRRRGAGPWRGGAARAQRGGRRLCVRSGGCRRPRALRHARRSAVGRISALAARAAARDPPGVRAARRCWLAAAARRLCHCGGGARGGRMRAAGGGGARAEV